MTGQTSTSGIVAREVCKRVHNNLTSPTTPNRGPRQSRSAPGHSSPTS
jgi:hypothetical protein